MPVRVLTDADVRSLVAMGDAIASVRAAFVDLHAGAFTEPVSHEVEDLVVKSVVHRPSRTAVVKTLTVNPDRPPFVSGVVTLLDAAARTELVSGAASVTAIRTGALVGVATDLLADRDARHLVLVGAGAQGVDQVRAVHAVRALETLTVVDNRRPRAEALLEALRGELPGVACSVADDVRTALRGCDVVCCATSSPEPVFDAADLPARVHVNAIGSFRPTMRELPAELLASATVVVDRRAASLHEAGEIVHAVRTGALTEDDLVEVGDLVAGGVPHTPRTVFKTVGIAVQDWALMRLLSAVAG